MGSGKQRKFLRVMEFFILYYPPTNSYFINKSKSSATSARHQFSRAFNQTRRDYETNPLYQDIRKYGKEAFLVRYCLEMPEWAECRAHYVQNTEPNDEIYKQVLEMRKEPTPPIKPEPRKKRFENER